MNVSSVGTPTAFTADKSAGNGSEIRSVPEVSGTNKSSSQQETKMFTPDERRHQVNQKIEKVLQAIQGPETTIERSVHEGTNHIVYKLKDKVSGEVIKEIPEEKLLDIAHKIMELAGLVIDERV